MKSTLHRQRTYSSPYAVPPARQEKQLTKRQKHEIEVCLNCPLTVCYAGKSEYCKKHMRG